MSPNTDNSQAIASTLAVLQGRESLSSLIDELDEQEYRRFYSEADKLNRSNVVAVKTRKGYRTAKHPQMWARRVR